MIYKRVSTVAEAVEQADTNTRFLAGGQSLMPMINLRVASVGTVIDLNFISELSHIKCHGDTLIVGALVRHCTVASDAVIRRFAPVLAEGAALIGNPRVRQRGTIGGSVVHADPSSELVTALLALDASVIIQGREGQRVLSIPELLIGPMLTSLDTTDLLTQIVIPIRPNRSQTQAFEEVSRRLGDFAIAAAAVVIEMEEELIRFARVSLGGVRSTPSRLPEVEEILNGKIPRKSLWQEAGQLTTAIAGGESDAFCSATYRNHVAGVMVQRALERAFDKSCGRGLA